MSYKLSSIAVVAMALYAAGACADELPPKFLFSGFGTVGVVHSSEDQADFTDSRVKPSGAGYSDSWSADVDSVIGLQFTASLTPRLSAVLQVVSEQNYDGSYRPHVEWANIKYQFTPDLSLRGGRINLPAFLISDVGKVGFAIPWVRPPREVYALIPATNNDGVDASYRAQFNNFTNTLTFNYGQTDAKTPGGDVAKGREAWGFSDTIEHGPFTARITYQTIRLTVEGLHSLFNVFRQFGPEGNSLADKYDEFDTFFESTGLGVSYDPGDWFVMGEWGHADTHGVFGASTGWYVSGGYRFGEFTPYATYGQVKSDNLSDPGLTISALPPFLAGPATGLNGVLNSILSGKPVQNTVSVGGRWDLMKNMDLKLQLDHTDIGAGSSGTLINTQPGFQLGGQFTVFSVAVDFVF